jgi:hypothetical protein
MDADAQANALRLRLYVLCSECARLIDLAEGNQHPRRVEDMDLIRHCVEEHRDWLGVLGISES